MDMDLCDERHDGPSGDGRWRDALAAVRREATSLSLSHAARGELHSILHRLENLMTSTGDGQPTPPAPRAQPPPLLRHALRRGSLPSLPPVIPRRTSSFSDEPPSAQTPGCFAPIHAFASQPSTPLMYNHAEPSPSKTARWSRSMPCIAQPPSVGHMVSGDDDGGDDGIDDHVSLRGLDSGSDGAAMDIGGDSVRDGFRTPRLSGLLDLPVEVLALVVAALPSPADVARVALVSRALSGPATGDDQSVVERALRLRAPWVPRTLPPGQKTWSQALLWAERRRRALEPGTLAIGLFHTCCVRPDGTVVTVGAGLSRDQLRRECLTLDMRSVSESDLGAIVGVDESTSASAFITASVPRRLSGLDTVRITAVSARWLHTLALSDDGAVFSFGRGEFGRLGHGNGRDVRSPQRIDALRHVRAVDVAAGTAHSIVVASDGRTYTFGQGTHGRLGHGNEARQLVPKVVLGGDLGAETIVRASAGHAHSVLVGANGTAFTCGWGADGQLGHGALRSATLPQRVAALLEADVQVTQASAGSTHTLFVTTTGAVLACGRRGQADGDRTSIPALVEGVGGPVIHAHASLCHVRGHGVAVRVDGRVVTLGEVQDLVPLPETFHAAEACSASCNCARRAPPAHPSYAISTDWGALVRVTQPRVSHRAGAEPLPPDVQVLVPIE